MKIVVTGKGGVGKSTVAGTLARIAAARGHRVVALDADPNPNLAVSVGLGPGEAERLEPVLNALLAAGHTHADPKPDPEDLLHRFGVPGPDGLVVLATGRIERPTDACLCCGSHTTTRALFGDLQGADRVIVADLEAGLNDLIWASPAEHDVVLVVADPSAKAVEVARRAKELAGSMGVHRVIGVANRCGADAGDRTRLADALGVAASDVFPVPEDAAVEQADRVGAAPIDTAPDSPAVVAVGRLADQLLAPA